MQTEDTKDIQRKQFLKLRKFQKLGSTNHQ